MEESRKRKRWISLSIIGLLFVLAAVALFCLWFFIWRFEVSTDDAYVHGNVIPISSKISAPVTQVYFDESSYVHEGDLLIELDPSTAEAELISAKGALAASVRNYFELIDKADAAKETLKIRQAQRDLAHYTFFHKSNLDGLGVLPGADIQSAQTNYEVAESELLIAHADYSSILAQIEGTTLRTHPLVQEAEGKVISAYLNLMNSKIYAPASGYIGIREVQPGELVMPGKTLINVIPLDTIWVEANYKENEIRYLGLGQPVMLYSDTYGKSVSYKGTVRGISPGTGAVFSYLPAQNATGNWIKVVQRVPVIIELQPDEIRKHPLLLGLSMHAKVHIDEKAPILTNVSRPTFKLLTTIYDEQSAHAKALVEQIIQENSLDSRACAKGPSIIERRELLTLLTGGRF